MLCPDGHRSTATDWCDVCGMPMTAAPESAAPPAPEPPASSTQSCPHCGAVNAADNLFCEVCGFDFTTGVMPRIEGPSFLTPVTPLTPAGPDTSPPPASSAAESGAAAGMVDASTAADGGSSPQADLLGPTPTLDALPESSPDARPELSTSPDDAEAGTPGAGEPPASALDLGAPPVAGLRRGEEHPDPGMPVARPAAVPSPHETGAAATAAQLPSGGPGTGMSAAPAASGAAAPEAPAEVSARVRPVHRPPSRAMAGDWVVEVWIDPDWFAVQDTGEDFPSVAPPEIVRLTGSDALIGRRSRTGAPDVDCGLDSAVSRRQALLTSDGRRWWIEDLDSSNGTWVAPAIGPLPDAPITGRTEVDADDRIYVGAWTRLVVRPAAPSELA